MYHLLLWSSPHKYPHFHHFLICSGEQHFTNLTFSFSLSFSAPNKKRGKTWELPSESARPQAALTRSRNTTARISCPTNVTTTAEASTRRPCSRKSRAPPATRARGRRAQDRLCRRLRDRPDPLTLGTRTRRIPIAVRRPPSSEGDPIRTRVRALRPREAPLPMRERRRDLEDRCRLVDLPEGRTAMVGRRTVGLRAIRTRRKDREIFPR